MEEENITTNSNDQNTMTNDGGQAAEGEAGAVDSGQLEGKPEGGNSPGAVGGQGAGLGSESDKVPLENIEPAESPAGLEADKIEAKPPAGGGQNPLTALLQKCKAVIAAKKQKKLEKIVELARQKGKINNADICKLLHASQSSATRYTEELVRQGRIKRFGTAKNTFYQAN
jgi:hypothetical protein